MADEDDFADFTPDGVKQLITANNDALDDWNAARGIRTERMDMKDAITRLEAENRELRARLETVEADYFGQLVTRARQAADKASRKFPQPNYVALKIAEEAGEVIRGGVHYAEGRMEWAEVEGEIVQLLAMLFRFVTEGDEINGIIPPAAIRSLKDKDQQNG